ncbi:Carrier protein, mitochondrial [Dionaea muscipula]
MLVFFVPHYSFSPFSFKSEKTRKIIALGTIALATIEKFNKIAMKQLSTSRQSDKSPSQRLLQVFGKDMRIIVFGFRARTKQRRAVFDTLVRWTRPLRLWDLYAFTSGACTYSGTNQKVRLLDEYFRLLGIGSTYRASDDMIEEGTFTMSNEWWRISGINSKYTHCSTYPFALMFPKFITDDEVMQASTFRSSRRLPVISWCHPANGAVLARSSQPLVGLVLNMRSNTDEKLVAALCTQLRGSNSKEGQRKLYIADARPRKNALANGAFGGGSESASNYFQSEVVFLGIHNIHVMRESMARLREYLDAHGTTSSDGTSSFLRQGGWSWGGGNLSGMSASVSTLGDTGWLTHVHCILASSAWIAARIAKESTSVLVHCTDGWDRTTQLVSLASLLLDPYYRTFMGFQALVEKDWLAFGHPFSERLGMPTISGSDSLSFELTRQASAGIMHSSPVRQQSGLLTPPQGPSSSPAQTSNNYSPIFLQNVLEKIMLDNAVEMLYAAEIQVCEWIDCVAQLLRMYPFAFEFSSTFLVDFLDCVLSCRFGNFLCNSEKEREQSGVHDSCGCLWSYLANLRASGGQSHVHYNLFYDPVKHEGPLLPPAAAISPILWPQFHLRWVCPEEVEAGNVEAKSFSMATKLSELQKAKEVVERKNKEISASVESLTVELRNERRLSTSAMNLAKKASKENDAIKRAVQSLGCKIHFSSGGETTVDVEGYPSASLEQLIFSPSKRESAGGTVQQKEKSDLSVSVSVMPDDDVPMDPLSELCESLCPFRPRDGRCRWPEAGCAQVGSQFIGLKANFDAFDRLSIDDSYF